MDNISEIFKDLIRVSLGIKSCLSHIPTTEEWEGVFNMASSHSIIGITFCGLKRIYGNKNTHYQMVNMPTVSIMKWYGYSNLLSNRNELLDNRCSELVKIFSNYGYRTCILKGQGLAQLYPNPQSRSNGDIDLWVEGTRDDIISFIRSKWKVENILVYHADAKIFKDTMVEIHYLPAFSYNPIRYHRYCCFFNKEGNTQFQLYDRNLGYTHPDIDFNAIYGLIHIFSHALSNRVMMKQIVDYYFILNSLQNANFRKLNETISSLGLKKFTGALMWVLTDGLSLIERRKTICSPHEAAGAHLLKKIMNDNVTKYDKFIDCVLDIVYYPSEILCIPIWKLWHFFWRKYKGYL